MLHCMIRNIQRIATHVAARMERNSRYVMPILIMMFLFEDIS